MSKGADIIDIEQQKNIDRLSSVMACAPQNEDPFLFAIRDLCNLDLTDDTVCRYIVYIIENDAFKVDYIELLDVTIGVQCGFSLTLFVDIIKALSRFRIKRIAKLLDNCVYNILNNYKEDFSETVVSLICDLNGYVRSAGRELWDKHNLCNSTIDISSFSNDIQFCFVVSMLQDLGNPRSRLPKLLPLLDAGDTISLLLIRQLHPYIRNYMGHVIIELEKLDIKNQEAVKIIKEYCDNVSSFRKNRQLCKELDPNYTQSSIVKESAKAFQEYVNENFKFEESGSLLSLFKPIQLARGVCSRDECGNERELPLLSSSVPKPVMTESMSIYEELEFGKKIFLDWSNYTKAEEIWKIL